MKRSELFNKNRKIEMEGEITKQDLIDQVRALTDSQQRLYDVIHDLRTRQNDSALHFRTPDQINNLDEFNGNKKLALAWIDDAEKTLQEFEHLEGQEIHRKIIFALKKKITGEAKEVLVAGGNPSTWPEIKNIILNSFGDRRDLTSHIQSLFYSRQGRSTLTEYYQKIRTIDTAIKMIAASTEEYRESITAINSLISLITMTRFIDGLGDNLSMNVRSYRPSSLEEAHCISMQFSNAAYRQKLENPLTKPPMRPPTQNRPNPQNFSNKFNQSKPESGRFRKPNSDEDASMRTVRSRMQVNTHSSGNNENETNNSAAVEPELDTTRGEDNPLMESSDDEYFVGEELNFLQGFREKRET